MSKESRMPYWLALIILTALEIRQLILIHQIDFDSIVSAAQGVVTGTPHWRAYQNRLLGPWLVQGVSLLTGQGYAHGYQLVTSFLLLAANFLCFALFTRLTGRPQAGLVYTGAGILGFLLLQDSIWLYLWDYWDYLVFLVFVYGAYRRRGLAYFVPLFLVELLNREAAMFISVWLVLDAFSLPGEFPGLKGARLTDRSKLLAGAALTAAGIAWTGYIRDRLFRYSSLPGVGYDLEHKHGNFLTLSVNGDQFRQVLTQPSPLLDIVSYVLIPLAVGTLWLCRHRLSGQAAKLSWLFLLILAAILITALVRETRVFLSTIPFLLILHFAISQSAPAVSPRSAAADPIPAPRE